jgi:hypothetical protein
VFFACALTKKRFLTLLLLSLHLFSGPLPIGSATYASLQQLYVSGTGVTGRVPESWKALSSLQQLTMDGTQLQCALVVDDQNQVMETISFRSSRLAGT